jgi:hypothetical protein
MSDTKFSKWRDEVFASGDMEAIKLGVPQDEVLRALGKPDSISVDPAGKKATVLAYGDFRFHFDPSNEPRLSLIYTPDADRIP